MHKLSENRGVARHTNFGDFDISIEIPAGSYRSGTNAHGEKWSQKMHSHYGYIKLTGAPDGDHLDCFLRKKPKKDSKIFVIHQLRPDGSEYDEDKVMLGYSSANEAKKEWRMHAYKPNKMFGSMSEWDPEHFKHVVHACRNSNACMARDHIFDKLSDMKVLQSNIKRPKDVLSKLSESRRPVMKKLTECNNLNEAFNMLNESNALIREMEPYDQMLKNAGFKKQAGGRVQGGNITYSNTPYVVTVKIHPFGKVTSWQFYYNDRKLTSGTNIEELEDTLQTEINEDEDYVDSVMESLSVNLHQYDLFEKDARRDELNRMNEWQLYRIYSNLSEDINDLDVMNKGAVIEQILSMEGY